MRTHVRLRVLGVGLVLVGHCRGVGHALVMMNSDASYTLPVILTSPAS